MKRSEVAEKDLWKLEDIFESDSAWEKCFSGVKKKVEQIQKMKGKLGDKKMLLECLHAEDSLSMDIENLYVFARMRKDENNAVDKYQAMFARAEMLSADVGATLSWMTPELTAQSEEYLSGCAADPDFEDYDYNLKEIIRNKKHILSEKEERILALSRDSLSGYQNTFTMIDNVDLTFKPVNADGKKIPLTHGTFAVLLSNPDQAVRRQAFKKYYAPFKAFSNTIASNYAGSVKAKVFFARARGYEDCLSMSMDGENVPKGVYTNLVEAVGEGTAALHRYIELRKKILGIDLHMHDLHVPIVKGADLKMEFEEAYNLVIEALAPLGEEYRGLLERARAERWIDVYETENKKSGAYSWGTYTSHPYVLLNYQKTTSDVFTIAHEMGHALHSYYSDNALSYNKAQYRIFVAEVASTVNEVLLLKHLIAKTKDIDVKKYLLSYYLDMFRTTMFRQTMFAEFEAIAHKMAETNKPITQKSLSDAYYKLNKKYYGSGVKHDSEIRYEWARIPHFYNAFYVYKYATGITSAVNIATSILKNGQSAVDAYKKFLKAGGSMSPYEILKLANVDLMKKEPFNEAIKQFNEALDELEKLS